MVAVTRGSQIAAELLVVCIIWWYTYQSYKLYRIRKGIKIGQSISSLLLYNGKFAESCIIASQLTWHVVRQHLFSVRLDSYNNFTSGFTAIFADLSLS